MIDASSDDQAVCSMSKKGEILCAANVLFEPGQLVEVRLKAATATSPRGTSKITTRWRPYL